MPLLLLSPSASACSNDGAEADAEREATAAPSFRPALRPPRRVRLSTCDEEPELSSCLPPCSGRVRRVSEGCWEEDEAEAEAAATATASVVGARRPNGVATTRGAAAAFAPLMQEPTREAPRAACRGAIRTSGFCFLAKGERASCSFAFVSLGRVWEFSMKMKIKAEKKKAKAITQKSSERKKKNSIALSLSLSLSLVHLASQSQLDRRELCFPR